MLVAHYLIKENMKEQIKQFNATVCVGTWKFLSFKL